MLLKLHNANKLDDDASTLVYAHSNCLVPPDAVAAACRRGEAYRQRIHQGRRRRGQLGHHFSTMRSATGSTTSLVPTQLPASITGQNEATLEP